MATQGHGSVVTVRAATLVLALAGVAAAALPAHAGKTETRPYALELDVVWGTPIGPESWREDLERIIANEIGARHCFTSVELHDPERPPSERLVLRVGIDDYLERSIFGVGISTLQAPDAAPETRQSQVAEIKAMFDLQLISLPGNHPVRSRRFGEGATYRPVMNEDPRYESRTRMLESLRLAIAKFACKGSNEQFEKELARSRTAARGEGDASR